MRLRLSIFFAFIFALVAGSTLAALPASGSEGPLTGVLVCLDPGHGGADPGAVKEAYALYESEINLDVAYALSALLRGDGAAVVMTRTGDTYLTNRDRYTFCNNKGATILVSVHTNSVDDPTWDGSMTLYFKSEDKVLAQAIHDHLYFALLEGAPDKAAFRDWGLSKFASGVLLKSDMPAAMMEPLFMSNADEAVLLVEPIANDLSNLSCRRGQIAQAVHQGILNYFVGNVPTPTPPPEPGGTMHVANIAMTYEKKGPNVLVYTQVTILDDDGVAVSGAAVSVTTTQPDGSSGLSTDITGEDGTVTFKLRSGQTGTYTSEITGVSKVGWIYDPAANEVDTVQTVTVP